MRDTVLGQNTGRSRNYDSFSGGIFVICVMLGVVFLGVPSLTQHSLEQHANTSKVPSALTQSGLPSSLLWSGESNQNLSLYGQSVASGDFNHDGLIDLAVGGPQYSPSPNLNQAGRVFVYYGTLQGINSTASWTMNGSGAGATFGASLSTADVNGDGFSDLIVGAPDSTNPLGNFYGHVYVYYGSGIGLSQTANWSLAGGQVISQLGQSVAGGSVNGDVYQDVIVGAPGDLNPITFRYTGMAYVYSGSVNGLSSIPSWKAGIPDSNQIAGANYGYSVSFLGDVNHDGYPDLAVGAPNYDVASVAGNSHEGKVYVYYGGQTGPSTGPGWTGQGNIVKEEYGFSIAGAGDVNRDGFSDMIVGAPCEASLCTVSPATFGLALLYLGTSTGLSSNVAWQSNGGQAYSAYGYSVSSAGDINSDGYSDIIIGAPYYSNEFENEGRVYTFYGSSQGLAAMPSWTGDCDQNYCNYGSSVSAAGDVNLDGAMDSMIGATRHRSQSNNFLVDGWAVVYAGISALPMSSGAPAAGGPRLRAV